MAKTYKFAAYGWLHPAFNAPTFLIGRYRTRLLARLAAWWFRVGEADAHSWVREEHIIVLVEGGRRV